MNRHDKRRAVKIQRQKQRRGNKVTKQIAKAAENLAKQWVTEEYAKAQRETADQEKEDRVRALAQRLHDAGAAQDGQ